MAAPDRPHTSSWVRAGQRKSGTVELRREDYLDEYGEHRPRFFVRIDQLVADGARALRREPARASATRCRAPSRRRYDVVRFIIVGIVRIMQGKVSISTLGGPITVYDVVGEESEKGVSYFVWAMARHLHQPRPHQPAAHPRARRRAPRSSSSSRPCCAARSPCACARSRASSGCVILVALMGVAFKNDVERRRDVIQSQLKELVD